VKLALTAEKSIPVLTVSDGITEHDVQVLRAGITQLFRSGKNKIILEVPNLDSMPGEVIRQLSSFDILARELSGRLVVAGVSQVLKTKIEVFAKPPVILTFENRAKAVEFFTAPPVPTVSLGPAGSAAASAGGAVASVGTLASSAISAEGEALRAEENSLKQRLKTLEKENKDLREQVVLATIARRVPKDEAAYLQKIQTLEAKIEKLLAEAPVAPAAPAAPNAPTKT
jgi:anti-anti-sigma regulatory factor